ncbi:MAG TPA: hypothetical protein PLA97_17115 [Rubrivivax sp.]|nr:hypothetical protein [Rubrivivax sp.]
MHLFIVSVDRDATGFQASARRVDEEVAGTFDQPQTLLEFLVGRLNETPDHRAQGAPDANDGSA